MPKQIKIGFDKIPAPDFPSYEPLYDIDRAVQLRDSAGNVLVTTVDTPLSSYNRMRNSTSISVNNGYDTNINENVKIVEQFSETSQVSTSLLGVPRAETQLSLFADVSTYGYDVNTWDYYTYSSPIFYPPEWYNRRNPVYGERTQVEFIESTDEQALSLKAFPVQYTYPYGPKWTNNGRYDDISFKRYMNFIAIGRILYDYFYYNTETDAIISESLRQYAKNNFLSENITIVNEADEPFSDYSIDATGQITNSSSFYDVLYGESPQLSFDEIERFTVTYGKMLGGEYEFPLESFSTNTIYYGLFAGSEDRRPGYTSLSTYFGVLESKDVYRYQPGRISGFTFGVRANSDQSLSNILEWGCSNSTDQYMFQIRGSKFNIVRRSTIPLGNEVVVNRLGLEEDSEKLIYSEGLDNETPLWEVAISRDDFNGDSLDGNGPSGYIADLKKVTMFKIEFGWYGAIGARFYAYIPSENDQARWVVLHTLVIENGIGKPCLQNPEFKFRYYMGLRDTSIIAEPIYIYKYGASYYIDGGDEGTVKLYSATSEPKDFSTDTPIIGIIPKINISNSVGEKSKNQILSYPTSITVRTDEPAKIEFTKIIGSPEGFHYHYSPSLHNLKGAIKEISLVSTTSLHTNGTFNNIPVSGGSGSGARVNITISGGLITSVSLSNAGINYSKNDLLFISTIYIGGTVNAKILATSVDESKSKNVTLTIVENGSSIQINDKLSLSIENGGSGYTDGTYYDVSLSGGSGQYATADVTIINGIVSFIRIKNSGLGYNELEILSFADTTSGLGNGFSCIISEIITEYFLNSDYNKKVIANGIYNCYLLPNTNASEEPQTTARVGRNNSYEVTARKILDQVELVDGTDSNLYNIPFAAKITGLNDTILKATVPIHSNNFNIHFLNPISIDQTYKKHFADFCIGITDKNIQIEEITDDFNQVIDKKFVYQIDDVSYDYDIYKNLYVKWCHESEQLNINGVEIREWEPSYGYRMEVDPRLPNPSGLDSGRISKLVGKISYNNFTVTEIAPINLAEFEYRLYFEIGKAPTITQEEIGNVTIGIDNQSTNITFMSSIQTETVNIDDIPTEKNYLLVKGSDASDIRPNTEIQTKSILISDDFQVISYNSEGSQRFLNKFFNYVQNINFGSEEIYLIIGMNDDAKINGIIIEEIKANQTLTSNPIWETNLLYEDTIIVNSGNSSAILTPSNFIEIERLASSKIDTQTLQPLRPGVTFHSLYVSPNDSKPINLSKIFGRDRYKVTSGLKNNNAIFITSSSIANSGEIDISVNIKEQ